MFKPLIYGNATTRLVFILALTCVVLMLLPQNAYASGSAMPWEAPLTKILKSIEGPVAKIFGTIAIIMAGIGLAFGDTGGGMRTLIKIVFGLSIAFTATSFFLSFFKFSGGALI